VPIVTGSNRFDVRLTSGPRPRLTATVTHAAWKDEAAGLVTVDVQLTNSGERSAHELTLAIPAAEGAPEVVEVTPRDLPVLLVAGKSPLRLTLRTTPETLPTARKLALNWSGRDSDGAPRAQEIVCEWTPPAASPTVVAAASPRGSAPVGAAIGAVLAFLFVHLRRRSRDVRGLP
jgi:hypothetical protein